VTSTLSGNCGFTLAPSSPTAADYLVRMLAVVEGMPLDALLAGVPGGWSTTAEYLERIAAGGLAINAGFMVGHCALRRVVMGSAAVERPARPAELAAMVAMLRDGLAAGALGFSSSWGPAHFDADGAKVPSRHADRDELVALAGACRDFPGTSLEFIPARADRFDAEQLEVMTAMSSAAGRPLNWNVIRILADNTDETARVLAPGIHARDHGAKIVVLHMPIPSRARFSFLTGFVLDALPGWGPVMALPVDERVRALADPAVRARLAEGASRAEGGLAEIAQFANRVICETHAPETARYLGRLVADIAAEEAATPLEALLDIVCADGLRTMFTRPASELSRADWEVGVAAWRDGRALIGGSDAGAHLDFTAYFDYPVYVIEHAVRRHGALSLEEAVHLMTDVPARLYGLRDRGRIEVGGRADLVVFDEATVACGEIVTRHDLPAGAGRLYAEPTGIDRVIVNGVTIVADGSLTGARPGTLLRAGRDTETPSMV
jgi:N-acyl-D-aspartate/D-glutamate deacylase